MGYAEPCLHVVFHTNHKYMKPKKSEDDDDIHDDVDWMDPVMMMMMLGDSIILKSTALSRCLFFL